MSGFNLPPGVSESDIPGNRPEDLAYEMWIGTLNTRHIADAIVEGLLDSVDDYMYGADITDKLYAHKEFANALEDVMNNEISIDIVGRIGAAYGVNKSFEEYCE